MSHPPIATLAYGYSLGALLSDPNRPDWAQHADDNDRLTDAAAQQLLLAAGQNADGPTWRCEELLEERCGLKLLTVCVDSDDHTFLAAWHHTAYANADEFDLPGCGPDVAQRLDDALGVLGVHATHPAPRCVLIPSI
jgi:hypothetical protein